MPAIPKKVSERLTFALKKFQPILTASKARDDGEADTVMIVTDMLADVFGYDKYSEVTAEYAIRGTFCDLATKIDGAIQALVEVKAIGLELKDAHVKQAVDYAANQGVDWVVLTNGTHWRIYNVIFGKPIDQELVIDIDVCSLNPKSQADLEVVFLFCKEGWIKSVLGDYQLQKQALSRFFLGALVLSDAVLDVIRRELRRVSPDAKIEIEQIRDVLAAEVLKREVIDGDKAIEAKKKIARAANKLLRKRSKAEEMGNGGGTTVGQSVTLAEEAKKNC
jgi:predicted type IV restriction endonuclease